VPDGFVTATEPLQGLPAFHAETSDRGGSCIPGFFTEHSIRNASKNTLSSIASLKSSGS
jgi:hypothetical protein